MSKIELVEVGPRDGLQNAPVTVAPAIKVELISRILAAGVSRVEAVSFVSPTRVPQMAEAEEVMAALPAELRDASCGLVLNARGYDRLLSTGLRDVRFTVGASNAFNLQNARTGTAEGADAAIDVLARARAGGLRTAFVVATAFGCPYSGPVDPGHVIDLVSPFADAGVDEIGFADTIGVAGPSDVRRLVTRAGSLGSKLSVHFHNTRNTGYANVYAALEAGATVIDASIGGLGGCPFAPGATGNVATEDVLYLLRREGIDLGVDLDRLIDTAKWLRDRTRLSLPGQLHRVPRYPPSPAPAAMDRGEIPQPIAGLDRCSQTLDIRTS